MKKWHELGKELRRLINPDTFPIAVQLLAPEIQIPEGVKNSFKRSQGNNSPLPGCSYQP